MATKILPRRAWISGDTLTYTCGDHQHELAISAIKIIAEATNDHGPFGDDYFLTLALSADDVHEIPCGLDGMDSVVRYLTERYLPAWAWKLAGCTTYATNILWPPGLAGGPLFEYTENWHDNRVVRVLQRIMGGPFSNIQRLTDAAVRHLRGDRDPLT